MANTRGVFSLRKLAEEKIPLNEWVDLDNVWHSPSPSGGGPETGYFGGGLLSSSFPTSTKMDKLTYSDETITFTPSANLVNGKYTAASFGNKTHGFIAGGKDDTENSQVTVEKTTYASDSTEALPSGANISAGERQQLAGTGNDTEGYIAGGGGPNLSIVDKITYSTDTTSRVPGANLSLARYGMGASSSSVAGYFGGGTSPSKSTMDRLT